MVRTWFNISVCAILIIAGTAKILSALGHAEILQRIDPIFGIQFGRLIFFAGILELLVACICLFKRFQILRLLLTAWLATCLLIYRGGLWWIGWQRPCHCLGDFADALHISPQVADTTMKVILAYLFIGSYAILFRFLWQYKRTSITSSSAK